MNKNTDPIICFYAKQINCCKKGSQIPKQILPLTSFKNILIFYVILQQIWYLIDFSHDCQIMSMFSSEHLFFFKYKGIKKFKSLTRYKTFRSLKAGYLVAERLYGMSFPINFIQLQNPCKIQWIKIYNYFCKQIFEFFIMTRVLGR